MSPSLLRCSIRRPRAARAAWAVFFVLPLLVSAQNAPDSSPDQSSSAKAPAPEPVDWFPKGPLGLKWVSIGFRVPVLLHPEVPAQNSSTGTALPSTTFATTNQTSRLSFGLALEFPIYHHFTLTAEGMVHHVGYMQVETINQSDPNAGANIVTTFTDNTKALEYEFPVMLRYTGFRSSGFLSKIYVAGGEAYRKVGHVRTTVDYSNAVPGETTATATSTTPASPNQRTMRGNMGAIGFRFTDDFNIRVAPEIRYTMWQGQIFDSETTHTRKDELQAGVSFTF